MVRTKEGHRIQVTIVYQLYHFILLFLAQASARAHATTPAPHTASRKAVPPSQRREGPSTKGDTLAAQVCTNYHLAVI